MDEDCILSPKKKTIDTERSFEFLKADIDANVDEEVTK